MSAPIKPALTAEEWTHREFAIAGAQKGDTLFAYVKPETGMIHVGWNGDVLRPIAHLQALAALALHGQPFGFTREDVKYLRVLADLDVVMRDQMGITAQLLGTDPPVPKAKPREWILNLADRIEALLPT